MKHKLADATVCIIGLGYVGLALAEAFSRKVKVIGFDNNARKIAGLSRQINSKDDNTSLSNAILTTQPEEISKADFIIICVPTPVTSSKEPDISFVKDAAATVGLHLGSGKTVILESTVFPGVTEDIVAPILEDKSGLKCGHDFKIGYSPERVNPGDDEHSVTRMIKVVAGMDEETTREIAELYGMITPGIFRAKDIKTAEAAKVIENIQRDLNIALMNELALIFDKMGLDTKAVLSAAATKWNFQPYTPGLVGGHCIPVDPYYLVYKAREIGYHPQLILAGRATNDAMPKHIAQLTIKALNNAGKVIKDSRVLIMGLTYKENVPDTRESPAIGIIHELHEFGVKVYGYDPLLDDVEKEFGIMTVKQLDELKAIDAVILTVAHSSFSKLMLKELKAIMADKPILLDIRNIFSREEAEKEGFYYRSL